MGVRSSGSHPTTTKADGHLLKYFRQTFSGGGGGTNYVPPTEGITATGGVISDYTEPGPGNIYRAHVFTATGEFDVTVAGGLYNDEVDYLLIGGGGGGGFANQGDGGGGGGGGGVGLGGGARRGVRREAFLTRARRDGTRRRFDVDDARRDARERATSTREMSPSSSKNRWRTQVWRDDVATRRRRRRRRGAPKKYWKLFVASVRTPDA